MYVQKISVTLASSSTGAASVAVYTPVLDGRLLSVRLSTDGTLSSTAVTTITNEGTGEAVLTKALAAGTTYRPRATLCGLTGTAIYHTTGTANPQTDYLTLANERLKFAVGACAAAGQSGTVKLHIG